MMSNVLSTQFLPSFLVNNITSRRICFLQLDGDQKELFATGRSQEPLITRMSSGGDQLALAHDRETIFVDAQGNASCNFTLKWDEQPFALG